MAVTKYTQWFLYQQREKQLFEAQGAQLRTQVVIATEERDALRDQLRDFVVSL